MIESATSKRERLALEALERGGRGLIPPVVRDKGYYRVKLTRKGRRELALLRRRVKR